MNGASELPPCSERKGGAAVRCSALLNEAAARGRRERLGWMGVPARKEKRDRGDMTGAIVVALCVHYELSSSRN